MGEMMISCWDFTTLWDDHQWLIGAVLNQHTSWWIQIPLKFELDKCHDCAHMAYRKWCPFTRSCHFPSNVSRSDFVPDLTTGRSRYTSNKMSGCGFQWGKVHSFTNQKFRFLVLQSTKQHSPTSVQHPKDTVKCWSNVVKIWFHIPPDTNPSRTPRSRRPVADRPAAKSQAEANAPNRFRRWLGSGGNLLQFWLLELVSVLMRIQTSPQSSTKSTNRKKVWFFLNSKQKNDHPSQWIGLGENWNRKP